MILYIERLIHRNEKKFLYTKLKESVTLNSFSSKRIISCSMYIFCQISSFICALFITVQK